MPDFVHFEFPQVPAPDWPSAYISVPWLWRGRDAAIGLDCFGFLVDVYGQHFNLKVRDYLSAQTAKTDLDQALQTNHLIKAGIKDWVEVRYPSDGVAVLIRRAGNPVHVGICCGNDIIHCDQGLGGVVRERRIDLVNSILGYFVPAEIVVAPQ